MRNALACVGHQYLHIGVAVVHHHIATQRKGQFTTALHGVNGIFAQIFDDPLKQGGIDCSLNLDRRQVDMYMYTRRTATVVIGCHLLHNGAARPDAAVQGPNLFLRIVRL